MFLFGCYIYFICLYLDTKFVFIHSFFPNSHFKYTWWYMCLREKCPNTELFLVHILPHLDWIRRDTEYLSVFSPNAGKYGPEGTSYLDTFHAACGSKTYKVRQRTNTITDIILQFHHIHELGSYGWGFSFYHWFKFTSLEGTPTQQRNLKKFHLIWVTEVNFMKNFLPFGDVLQTSHC